MHWSRVGLVEELGQLKKQFWIVVRSAHCALVYMQNNGALWIENRDQEPTPPTPTLNLHFALQSHISGREKWPICYILEIVIYIRLSMDLVVTWSDGATYVSQLKCFTTSIISAALSPPLQSDSRPVSPKQWDGDKWTSVLGRIIFFHGAFKVTMSPHDPQIPRSSTTSTLV